LFVAIDWDRVTGTGTEFNEAVISLQSKGAELNCLYVYMPSERQAIAPESPRQQDLLNSIGEKSLDTPFI
jgi:hypothetical protein